MISNFLKDTHPEWQDILQEALLAMDKAYLATLASQDHYLPNQTMLFAAFKRPLTSMKYILFGESPYPRIDSANGYAFWDAAVENLWSDTGLSKAVNRATSLRNLIKMLLHARGDLSTDFSQPAIARLDSARYHQTAEAFFTHILNQGFMLLNASLVYQENNIPYHARQWAPFMAVLLDRLTVEKKATKLILFGRIAKKIPGYERFETVLAEHPYNLSFITNQVVIDFFKPMDLLLHDERKKYD
ncbi:MAG: uracil-DNA glycosylase [Gammaproteobacteria bacterium]|nr:uracil-DNA glycosylase [Gammaproteobacteria bacterium]